MKVSKRIRQLRAKKVRQDIILRRKNKIRHAIGFMSIAMESGNKKTGPIPVSTTTKETCPDACPLKRNGCYAEGWPLGLHWQRVTEGSAKQTDPNVALAQIEAMPDGQLWRHNQAGDLPGLGDEINAFGLRALAEANHGKRGFTYTHKVLTTARNRKAIKAANDDGFTINISANSLGEVDRAIAAQVGPVVTVLPSTVHGNVEIRTGEGVRVVVCPATYSKDWREATTPQERKADAAKSTVTCESCKLCAVATRKTVVGFPVHGTSAKKANVVAGGK